MFVLGGVSVGDEVLVTNSSNYKTKGIVTAVKDWVVEVKHNNTIDKFSIVTGIKENLRTGVELPLFAIPKKFS